MKACSKCGSALGWDLDCAIEPARHGGELPPARAVARRLTTPARPKRVELAQRDSDG
jgi:hypothetical protein